MEKYLSSTIQNIINVTLPMVIVTVVVAVVLRLTYLIKNKEHIILYKELFMLTFIIYILCLFQVVTIQDTVSWSSNNFIPFKEIMRYDFGSRLFMRNVIGNVILFVPFGYFVAYILKSGKIYLPLLITLITSVTIELVQLYIGRVFDIDDILLNVVGGIIGYLIYKIITAIGDSLPKVFKNEIFLDILSIIILALVIYVFIF